MSQCLKHVVKEAELILDKLFIPGFLIGLFAASVQPVFAGKFLASSGSIAAPDGATNSLSINRNSARGNCVLSAVEDDAGKMLVLTLSGKSPIPAPAIQYLPGPNATTIMVCDFYGVTWNKPTKVIDPPVPANILSAQSPYSRMPFKAYVQQIRLGQFQEYPAIFRIAVTANHPDAFRNFAFRSGPGTLVIKWGAPTRKASPPRQTSTLSESEPVFAPKVLSQQDVRPVFAPPINEPVRSYSMAQAMPAQTKSTYLPTAPQIKPIPVDAPQAAKSQPYLSSTQTARISAPTPGLPPSPSGQTKSPPLAQAFMPALKSFSITPAEPNSTIVRQAFDKSKTASLMTPTNTLPANTLTATPEISSTNPATTSPEILVSGVDPIVVQIKCPGKVKYRTFRLAGPDRYVIDCEGMQSIVSSFVPQCVENSYVKSIRVGVGDLENVGGRLVLDLVTSNVPISERFDETTNILSVFVGKQSPQAQTPQPVDLTKLPVVDLNKLSAPPSTTVLLDAGHGGSDPGAQRGDIQEKDMTLGITQKLAKCLQAKGIKVEMTRRDDTFVSLQDRVSQTNSLSPDLFVSVHINSLETTSEIHGIETYYQTEQSKALADSIHANLVQGLQAPDRFVRKARFYVVNHTQIPAVLAEVGFISNKEERDKLISSDYQEQVARSLACGIILYLNQQKQVGKTPAQNAQDLPAKTSSLPLGKEPN